MGAIRVAVVGAGLAGLAVATALRQAGAQCVVVEQADEIREVGAGIQLAPNATRLLHRLGLGPALDAVAVRPEAIVMRRWQDGSVIGETKLGSACESAYGAPYYTVHRADLHAALLGGAGEVRLGARGEVSEDGTVALAGGGRVEADVVVAADGIKSAARQLISPDEPRYTGVTVYRGLVPAEAVADRPLRDVTIWLGPSRHFVCYPISGGRQLSFVAARSGDDRRAESWTEPADPAEVQEAYEGWDERLRQIVAAAGNVTRWALHDRPTLDTWHRGRMVLAGDAAHPMLPVGAQGANQAIEDAVALAAVLREAGVDDLALRLAQYERARMARVAEVIASVQAKTRTHHVSDEDAAARDEAMRESMRLENQGWLFGYDAEAAVQDGGGQ